MSIRHITRSPRHLAACLLAVMLPCSPVFAQSSYELEKIEAAINAPGLATDAAVFDGSAFVAGTDPGAARAFMNASIKQLNNAIRTFNGLTADGQNSEAGSRLYDRITEMQAYVKGMQGALPAYEKAVAEAASAAPAPSAATTSAPATTTPPAAATNSATTPAATPATQPAPATPDADPQLAGILGSLVQLDAMLASGEYDGKDFDTLMSVEEVDAFAKDFVATANEAVAAVNALPADVGRTPEARKALDRLYTHLNTARTFRGAKTRHAQKRAAMDEIARQAEADAEAARVAAEEAARPDPRVGVQASCDAMRTALSDYEREISNLVQYEIADWDNIGGAKPARPEMRYQSAGVVNAVLDMAPICAMPEYQDAMALDIGCDDVRKNDPVTWCQTIAGYREDAEAVRQKELVTINSSYIPSVEDLDNHNGFFSWPWSEPSWETIMAKAEEELNELQLASFHEAIEGRAADWPPVSHAPDGQHTSYATELMQSIYDRDPAIDVVDTWLSRTSWKINRNSLGVIIDRTNLGYILYQRQGEPFCTLREFVIREPYSGGGGYEKTDSFRMQSLRFQPCGNR